MLLQPILLTCMSFTPLVVDPSMSTIEGTFEQSMFMPGTIIGNWDEVENPDGTSTLPGVWGGSGNNLIPCELTPMLGGAFNSPCEGGLTIEPNFSESKLFIDGLHLSAFNDAPGTFSVTLGMLYETFRTVQPGSLFPGGIQIDIPIGEGSLTTMLFEQSIPTKTELVQTGDQTWSFDAAVVVTITSEFEILGTSTGPLVTPGLLNITGTLEINESQYHINATSSWSTEELIENPPITFNDVPFEAPTVLPPGGVASLLLSAAAESATFTTVVSLQMSAFGATALPGDVNGDGVVSVADVLAIIAVWGPCDGCAEDLNNDGQVNVNDLLEVIANWSGS
jgi:hypothetical protein